MAKAKWSYKGQADITIGEVKTKQIAFVILLCLIGLFIVIGSLAYLYKNTLYDMVIRPEILLTDDAITLEVNTDTFDPGKYVFKKQDLNKEGYFMYYPPSFAVNTHKIGEYNAIYVLKTNYGQRPSALKVKVVDSTPPALELTQDSVTLTRNVDTFNPMSYVKSITDNYDKEVKPKVQDKIDWTANEVKVDYLVEDKAGNKDVKTLTVFIKDKPAAQSASSPSSSSPSYSGGSSGGYSGGYSGGSSAPFISGVHNVTLPVGSSAGEVLAAVSSGVSGSGSININAGNVNTTIPGSYTVTFTSSDGITKYATVTIQ